MNRPRVLSCDGCGATTTDAKTAGAFTAADVPGNARCPECLPEQVRAGGDLSCLR